MTHTHTHTEYDFSGRRVSPSQRLLPEHITRTRDRFPCPGRDSYPQSPGSVQRKTHVLDRAATAVGQYDSLLNKINFPINIIKFPQLVLAADAGGKKFATF